MIYVCPLSRIEETVAKTGARRMVTLLTAGTEVVRPAVLTKADHLHLIMHYIIDVLPDMTPTSDDHVAELGPEGADAHSLLCWRQPLDGGCLHGCSCTCARPR